MSAAPAWEAETDGPEDTLALARCLGRLAGPGDFFALVGPIGAGKSVFARGILEGLGVEADRGSPTFTLVHEYRGRLSAHHLDLYRLGTDAPREDLGYDELFYGDGVTLVEWAELVRDLWPPDHLEVRIERDAGAAPGHRRLRFHARGERSAALLRALAARRGEGAC